MKRDTSPRIRLVLLGFVVGLTLGAQSANADFTFGEATNLGPPINSPADDASRVMSPDGLELYLDSSRSGYDLWVIERATVSDPWGEPEKLWFNTSAVDFGPSLSTDGLEFYFSSNRGGTFDTWVATRAAL